MEDAISPPEYVIRDDGLRIAYRHTPGKSPEKFPGVVFLPGFKSDMQGGKAIALEAFCRDRGHAFTRLDYTGHGESDGTFEDGTIGAWAADAVQVLDAVTRGPQVLVGSSMGGWMMLLVALARPERVAGLVGIAAAPDFTRDLIPQALSDQQKQDLAETGYCWIETEYDDLEPYRIGKRLLDEGDEQILLDAEIDLDVPVRLIHGMRDPDVPWQTALNISEKLRGDDVEVILVKDGDHRLSDDLHIARMLRTTATLLGD